MTQNAEENSARRPGSDAMPVTQQLNQESDAANFEQFQIYCDQARVMYKPLEEKIKAYEQRNFNSVSSEYDLTEEKVKSLFDKFDSQELHDRSTMFDFIRTELLQLIQLRKQYCKDKKEEVKSQRKRGGIFRIGAPHSSSAPPTKHSNNLHSTAAAASKNEAMTATPDVQVNDFTLTNQKGQDAAGSGREGEFTLRSGKADSTYLSPKHQNGNFSNRLNQQQKVLRASNSSAPPTNQRVLQNPLVKQDVTDSHSQQKQMEKPRRKTASIFK